MKKYILLFSLLLGIFCSHAQDIVYSNYPVYDGNDLGLHYTPKESVFRIWAPEAEKAQLLLYNKDADGEQAGLINMDKSSNGVWIAKMKQDVKGNYYTFRVQVKGQWLDEVPDPYAKAAGTNGKRAEVVDLQETNPPGWENDRSPALLHPTDAIVYELHVRDASIAANSGISHKGKFIGLTEMGTKNEEGLSTGLDHLKELGVTHIQLLPCFDYNSVDESKPDSAQYNWGYDPLNYNIPEGSYSTNPANGSVRIKEFKQLIQTFHANGLGVIMDVVYNHTALTEKSNFNQLVPGYYYRQKSDGTFSDATACGNETASDRPMMGKFILESMKYWVQEYHIDGFRLDLMGVHDIATMNYISKELHKIKPQIILYGEGWTAGASPLPDSLRALKKNAYLLDHVGVFSDDIRDGIKGSVFDAADRGFASGKPGMEASIQFGIVASCPHPQVDYTKVNYSKAAYAREPWNTVTYCECHDNNTLWDKLLLSAPNATTAQRTEMQKLSLSIVLTSQGITFLHAGTEFLRSKKGVENSFKSPDSINAIDWSLKTKNKAVFDYVQGLIQMRKAHPAFHMSSAADIKTNIRFMDNHPAGIIGYTINGAAVNDNWKQVQVWLNGNDATLPVEVSAEWKTAVVNNLFTHESVQVGSTISLKPYSCTILYKE